VPLKKSYFFNKILLEHYDLEKSKPNKGQMVTIYGPKFENSLGNITYYDSSGQNE
jgi:hypothetical protein